jgi:uncharacterized protein (DUF4415 family)
MKKRDVRNPFYADIQREGIIFATPIQSLPHGNRKPSNPYYLRGEVEGMHVSLGRPKRHEKARPTRVKSVRLSPDVWKRVQAQAKREQISLNAALRQAVLIWLQS